MSTNPKDDRQQAFERTLDLLILSLLHYKQKRLARNNVAELARLEAFFEQQRKVIEKRTYPRLGPRPKGLVVPIEADDEEQESRGAASST